MTTCEAQTVLRPVVQGDVNQHKLIELDGVEDLAAVDSIVVSLRMKRTVATITDVTVDDAVNRIIDVDFGGPSGWLASESEPWNWEFQAFITTIDGAVTTWPDGPPAILPVIARNA